MMWAYVAILATAAVLLGAAAVHIARSTVADLHEDDEWDGPDGGAW